MSKLEKILQEEALREINRILSEAKEEAARIVAAAQEKAERIKEAAERRLAAEREAELARAQSAAELRVATARMAAKGEVIESVRREVARRLEDFPGRPEYPEVLVRLAEEALSAAPGAEELAAAPGDLAHLEAWAREKGLSLKAEPEVRLGVRVYASGGTTYVENTLLGRLEKAWEVLAARVAEVLWG